jgi:hypothetical protein
MVSVPGQKRVRILRLEEPVFRAFRDVTLPWPPSILFGHVRHTRQWGARELAGCGFVAMQNPQKVVDMVRLAASLTLHRAKHSMRLLPSVAAKACLDDTKYEAVSRKPLLAR